MFGQNIELQHNLGSFISVLVVLSAESDVLSFGLSRQLEQIQLELTKANEKAAQLEEHVEQTAQKAEQSQQETLKTHQAELKTLQDHLTDMVRTILKSLKLCRKMVPLLLELCFTVLPSTRKSRLRAANISTKILRQSMKKKFLSWWLNMMQISRGLSRTCRMQKRH